MRSSLSSSQSSTSSYDVLNFSLISEELEESSVPADIVSTADITDPYDPQYKLVFDNITKNVSQARCAVLQLDSRGSETVMQVTRCVL